jgi:aminomethyltransferase
MLQKTALHETHRLASARLVDFSGWEMPLHYGSQIDEHHAVRSDSGVFDVSHMLALDVSGDQAEALLRQVLANDVAKLQQDGQALYSCMLNSAGGVIDDLIVYRLAAGVYRLILNAGSATADLQHLQDAARSFAVTLVPRRDVALLAVQGPRAVERVMPLLPAGFEAALNLPSFHALAAGDWMVARTGYTGEDGFEILLPAAMASTFWAQLIGAGVRPAGLGARDTLRLEAGLNLYGQDMDETVSPLEANLGWTVAWEPSERDFIGREALARQRETGVTWRLTGIILDARGVLRHGVSVETSAGIGTVTSGSFSPTLGASIGFARVPAGSDLGEVSVVVRGKALPARLVRMPFVRNGQIRVPAGPANG